MFSLDEKVVYPGHGVAVIKRIVEKKVAGQTIKLYELKFMNADMTVLVPTNNLAAVGIRKLSSNEGINTIFEMLSEPAPQVSGDLMASNWNKRNKDYQCKLRTGDLQEICKIYRDLKNMSVYKELSLGEKALLQQTEMLLAQEISLVQNMDEGKAVELLRSLFNRHTSGSANSVATSL